MGIDPLHFLHGSPQRDRLRAVVLGAKCVVRHHRRCKGHQQTRTGNHNRQLFSHWIDLRIVQSFDPLLHTRGLLQGLRTTEGVLHHSVITLMTGKLVEIFRFLIIGIVCLPGKNEGPGPRIHRRVLDGNDILDRFRVDFREAFDESHVALREPLPTIAVQPGWTKSLLVREVGRIDNERIALPATARVPIQ